MSLLLSSIVPLSRANGPGKRTVFWTQGCHIGCVGCINPHTHDPAQYSLALHPREALTWVHDHAEGITISGGEPFEQGDVVSHLVLLAKDRGLTSVVYSGFTREDVAAQLKGLPSPIPQGRWLYRLTTLCDILVLGPYDRTLRVRGQPLISSSNQELVFSKISSYNTNDLQAIPGLEVLIDGENAIMTGHG